MVRAYRLSSTFRAAVLLGGLIALGCARVQNTPITTNQDGGATDVRRLSDAILLTCGNGRLDPTEQCDDGNTTPGDGCNQLCQQEGNWECMQPGQPCVFIAVCGNGLLTSDEACDDGNKVSGDGCSADCKTVEPGWQCRVPGKRCVPLCGDGKLTGSETCDDGNAVSGDGCSSTCLTEPGANCSAPGQPCIKSVCGNGKVEPGEICDCGTDPANLPAGCTGPNGLFNGDGTGCSKTCTKEPVCRGTTGSGATHACATSCGNGNVETGEDCDDGNLVNGDGCSSTCKLESGFTCMQAMKPDTQACQQSTNTGDCLELPIKYRDFKNETLPGGHPDFFYYGATITPPITVTNVTVPIPGTTNGASQNAPTFAFNKRYCVPNSAGPAKQNDSTARCWDIAQPNLDGNGRPAFNAARNGGGAAATLCACQFTDFSHDTNGGHVPGYNAATNGPLNSFGYVTGTSGHPVYKGTAPVVTSATTFGQWWNDGTWESDGANTNRHAVGFLELGPVAGATNLFRFSSAPHSVYGNFFPLDPAANAFPIYTLTGSFTGPGAIRGMPAPWSEPLLCNLWPYWYSSTVFGAGAGCIGDQYVFPPSFAMGMDPAAWFGMHLNGDWLVKTQGWFHDSWFSVEARDLFTFNGPFSLQFFGDDDTFVFINGVLVIDLGGVHQRLPGKVDVDDLGNATTQEGGSVYLPCTNPVGQTNACPVIPAGAAPGDMVPCTGPNAIEPVTKQAFNATCAGGTCDCRQRTVPLGLQKGSTYEIAVFSRDGHPTESNFQLTLSGFSTNITQCQPRCGDGVVSAGEECDCGDGSGPMPAGCDSANADDVYGGCTKSCKFGPFCGDKIVNGPEQCDLGRDNGSTVGADGCTFGCTRHYCGDGTVDPGEICDLGPLNGMPGQLCSSTCAFIIP
jgi:fibro-slime domain-containing protein